MLKNPRAFQLLAGETLHNAIIGAPLRRSIVGQLSKPLPRSTPQTRSFVTKNTRTWQCQSLLWPKRTPLFRCRRQARCNSGQATDALQEKKSLSARMKEMSRKYGWTVTGIYLGLSALDFPFCFLAVRWFGTERIAGIEHAIVRGFWTLVEKVIPSLTEKRLQREAIAAKEVAEDAGDAVAEDAKAKNPGLGTQLLLAYGVHKSLIFFRIPITLAITPKVVKTLRGWGWNIGRKAA